MRNSRNWTVELASWCNEFVAALGDEVFIAPAAIGGHLETIIWPLHAWKLHFCRPHPKLTSHN